MTDASTLKNLTVSVDGDALPYIMVSVEQAEKLRSVLDTNNVKYWVDEFAISLNGNPAITVFNLSGDSKTAFVQNLLDNAS